MLRRWQQAKLKREFEEFGAIKSLRVVHSSTTGKPRGYAFIEYHSSRDMKNAYKVRRPAKPHVAHPRARHHRRRYVQPHGGDRASSCGRWSLDWVSLRNAGGGEESGVALT